MRKVKKEDLFALAKGAIFGGKEKDIPGSAYIVYTDEVIQEIVDKYPVTISEMEEIMRDKKPYTANSKPYWEKILKAINVSV